MIATKLRGVGDKFGTPAMTATILRGILSHKIFEHVQNSRNYFAPFGDTCEKITNHWRLFQDCFKAHSRCVSPAVAKQSHSREIGALINQKGWPTQTILRLSYCASMHLRVLHFKNAPGMWQTITLSKIARNCFRLPFVAQLAIESSF